MFFIIRYLYFDNNDLNLNRENTNSNKKVKLFNNTRNNYKISLTSK